MLVGALIAISYRFKRPAVVIGAVLPETSPWMAYRQLRGQDWAGVSV